MTNSRSFWDDSEFRKFWGPAHYCSALSENQIAPIQNTIDPLLIDLWREDGWSTYGNGFLHTAPPVSLTQDCKTWLDRFGIRGLVFARTAWGHFFICEDHNTILIDPVEAEWKDLSCDPVTVLDVHLTSVEFLNAELRYGKYPSAVQEVGRPPGPGECFIETSTDSDQNSDGPVRVQLDDFSIVLQRLN